MRQPTFLAAGALLLSLSVQAASNGIRPWPDNPFYWELAGQPVLLLGGSDDDSLFQWPDLRAHLDQVAAVGGNYVRNTMSDRRDYGFEVSAFARRNDGRYDLERWNREYWKRFSNLLRWTAQRDIVVQIEIWDRFDYFKEHWEASPFNPGNNVNYGYSAAGFDRSYPGPAHEVPHPFFATIPDLADNAMVLRYQQRFVDKLLSISLRYPHVLYCISNETAGAEAWSAYWADYLHRQARKSRRQVYVTEMWDAWDLRHDMHRRTLDHPERYDFIELSQNQHKRGDVHWARLQGLREYVELRPRPLNTVKTYGADGGPFGGTRDGIERWWRHLIGGAAAVRFHRPPAGLGLLPPAAASIRAARKLESRIPLWQVQPANHLLGDRAQNEAFLAARPGDAYALYFPDGGSVTLDLDPAAAFQVQWIDIASGTWAGRQIVPGGNGVRVEAPGLGHWVVAITREGAEAVKIDAVRETTGDP